MFNKPLLLFVALFLAGCAGTQATPEPIQPGSLSAYSTQTPTATLTRNPFLVAVEPALPSPTPFLYTITTGDTFTRIADRFGISAADLQSANPGISPNALTIGMTIRIPTGPQDALTVEPTPTPVPLSIGQLACYPGEGGGQWCFALVENPYPTTLENITAQILLVDASNNVVASQLAITPLNILTPGRKMPLSVFFAPPLPDGLTPQVQVVTSTALLPVDLRYLPAEAQNITVSVDWSGRSAQVTGSVVLLGNSGAANQIWLAGVVYDVQGNVVGVRRFELGETLQPGGRLPFSFEIGSLGGLIERVDVLVEARP